MGYMLEIIRRLMQNYKNDHNAGGMPDPIEAIKGRMVQLNYSQTDLANIIGLKSRASEILNRKRKLTLDMIQKIHEGLNIPTDGLIQKY